MKEDATKLIADSEKSPIQKSSSTREPGQFGRASVGACLSPMLPQKCLSADKLPLVDETSVGSEVSKEEEGTSSRIMKWLRLSPKKKETRRSSLYS
ncbi:unnamed protein product [Enterobius vermicularis]|uniref:Uncharacterized protein n=1 Tax=Enterobius vermicularis TaxID=51028 RepID=A0A0N4VHL8_ENTVE|nr:unnamed protein product [Enterobius vermicularis]